MIFHLQGGRTDAALEFTRAARFIRAIKPLAYYKSAPYRPQANGRAERKNRDAIELTLCLLMTSGLSEK